MFVSAIFRQCDKPSRLLFNNLSTITRKYTNSNRITSTLESKDSLINKNSTYPEKILQSNNYLHSGRRFLAHHAHHDHADHHGDHGHHHEEPPHYAYRGDGLPDVKCEELQHMLHMNERLQAKLRDNPPAEHSNGAQPTLSCSDKLDPETMEVYAELQQLHNRVLAANWHDTVQLTMNMDIWVGSLDKLRRRGRDLPHVQLQALLAETLKMFDVLFQVEDLQDHLYELMEELSGSSDAVQNLNQHLSEVLSRYHELKRLYPEYTVKLKESVGYTLAVLRQRYTFDWPEEHSYFY